LNLYLTEFVRKLKKPRRFIQVLAGLRQVGKTTLALRAGAALPFPTHFATADEPGTKGAGAMPPPASMSSAEPIPKLDLCWSGRADCHSRPFWRRTRGSGSKPERPQVTRP
jgi:hypothetical protein